MLVKNEVASYTESEKSINLTTDVLTRDSNTLRQMQCYYLYARLRAENFTDSVVIDSENTDVHIQAVYVSHQIRGDLLMKCKDGSVKYQAMLLDEVAHDIIPPCDRLQ